MNPQIVKPTQSPFGDLDLSSLGIHVERIERNPAPARLYECAVLDDDGVITSTGALAVSSGEKTGRSPDQKRIVEHPDSSGDIDWGDINIPMSPESFQSNRERAIAYLNTLDRLFVIDGFAGCDPKHRLKIRMFCERAYHALFMHNMLVRPTEEELADFGEPDYIIYNAGRFPANPHIQEVEKPTSVDLDFEQCEIVILGTEYAGEMKKGVFTLMNYLLPKQGILSMHCSATEGSEGDVSLFFGLSGTGKTTLSADPKRHLIGDDEHGWSDDGVFNLEGGCYAKVIDISAEDEPQIDQAIRFGTVLENVVLDSRTRVVDYSDDSITANTRGSYPIEYIPGAKTSGRGESASNIILLTCDAFGVLPPLSRLTPEQAMYQFMSGYTAKIPGTEVGITEPQAAFSACFGAPFMVWPASKYAELLADFLRRHQAQAWLINTGWTGGPYGEGHRVELEYTRAMIDAVHSGELFKAETQEHPVFGFAVPTRCPGVPAEVLWPRETWDDSQAYDQKAQQLAEMFQENFTQFEEHASEEIRQAAPRTHVQQPS